MANFGSMGAPREPKGAPKGPNFKIYLLPQFLSDFDGRWLILKIRPIPRELSDEILNFYLGTEICSGKNSGKLETLISF